ncbi:MAG TPA: hypothetical protein PLV59_02125 [Candidatus Dojkabacteria bacterium]|nr:hypothetical protein [Candidatus Dojkabacteria bacterium]
MDIFLTILKWVIGLIIPLIVRYLVIKKSVTKWVAIGILVVNWFICAFLYFSLLESMDVMADVGVPIFVIISFAGYSILTN